MKKIYIIGPVGSGKTTLAKQLSKKYGIEMYELDKVVWDDENGNVKRKDDEINELFINIIEHESWIIEDVGRKKFNAGISNADIVYYINLKNYTIYRRCITRWMKQKLHIEKYNYKPTFKGLIQMLKWAHQDLKNKNIKLQYIKEHAKEYKILVKKDIDLLMS